MLGVVPVAVYPPTRRDYYDGYGYDDDYNSSEDRRLKDTIYEATDRKMTEPNWELNMSVVDQINTTMYGVWAATKFLKTRLGHKDPHVVYLTLVLLETCMKNCGWKIYCQVGRKSFLSLLVKLASKRISQFVQAKKRRDGKETKSKDKKDKGPKSAKEKAKEEMREKVEELVLKLIHLWSAIDPVSYLINVDTLYFRDVYLKLLDKGVEFPPFDPSELVPFQQNSKPKPAYRPQAGTVLSPSDGERYGGSVRVVVPYGPSGSVFPSNSLGQPAPKVLSMVDIEKMSSSCDLLLDCVHQADVDVLSNPLVQELVPSLVKNKQQVELLLTQQNIRDETLLASLFSVNDLLTRALDAHHEAEVTALSKLGLPATAAPDHSSSSSTSRVTTINYDDYETQSGRTPIILYDSSEDEECELILFGDEDDEEHRQLKERFAQRGAARGRGRGHQESQSAQKQQAKQQPATVTRQPLELPEMMFYQGDKDFDPSQWIVDDDFGTDKCMPSLGIVEPSHVREAKKHIKKEQQQKDQKGKGRDDGSGDDDDVPLVNKRRAKK